MHASEEKNIPIQKNDDITLPITTLGSDGQGIGRVEGYAVFVPGALAGETVRAHVLKTTANYGIAKLTQVLSSSGDRVEPTCPAFPACGGCTLQHMAYEAQLRAKKQWVEEALHKIGHLTDFELCDVIGMQDPWRYRNKGSFPFGLADGRAAFGFFAPRSHRLIPFDDCLIQHQDVALVAQTVRDWAAVNHVSVYDEQTHMGSLRHCVARTARDGSVMAVVVTHGKLPHKEALIELLRARIPHIKSILHNRNDARTNVIFGPAFDCLWGAETITDTICGLSFSVSAASFLQVNPTQTEALYTAALAMLNPTAQERIVDAYCGMGAIALLAAGHAGEVIGIENVPEAVEDAKQNAARNGLQNVTFLCDDAARALPALTREGKPIDAVIVDPPRKGCDPVVLDALCACGANRVIYVSCNPSTLARDCALLAQKGLRLARVQPVDMFPHTPHIETAALLQRETM